MIGTSRPTRPSKPARDAAQAGFTLVEVLVVIVLIAGLFTILAPQVGSYKRVSLNTAARELAAVFKEAYNAAQMTGRAYRLVYDLKKDEYWVEAGPKSLLLDTAESREAEKRRLRFAKDDEKPKSEFKQDSSITRKKQSLPRGVEFEAVYTDQTGSKEPAREGQAYTHIFPNGMTERTVVQVKDVRDTPMSLVLEPLLGNTRVERGLIDLEAAYASP